MMSSEGVGKILDMGTIDQEDECMYYAFRDFFIT